MQRELVCANKSHIFVLVNICIVTLNVLIANNVCMYINVYLPSVFSLVYRQCVVLHSHNAYTFSLNVCVIIIVRE